MASLPAQGHLHKKAFSVGNCWAADAQPQRMSCLLLPLLAAWDILGLSAPDVQHLRKQLDTYGPLSIRGCPSKVPVGGETAGRPC